MKLTCVTAIAVLVGACGGKPVGSKLPKPNPAHVAGVAAATAAALTLAEPDLAGRTPEDDREGRVRNPSTSDETVPADVLDRAEAAESADLPICPDATESGADANGDGEPESIDLSVPDHWTVPTESESPEPCRPADAVDHCDPLPEPGDACTVATMCTIPDSTDQYLQCTDGTWHLITEFPARVDVPHE